MLQIAQRCPSAILDSTWFDYTKPLAMALPGRLVEVHCTLPRDLAGSRYYARADALELTAEASDTGGWLLLDLVFADPDHAAAVLWALGPDAQIIQPPTLRDTLAGRAEQTLRRYRHK